MTLTQGEYFYTFLELTPKKDRPKIFADDEVSDPRLWGCIVVCFPEGNSANSKEALKYPFGPYHNEQDPKYRLISLLLAQDIKHMNREKTKYIGSPKSLPLESEENFAHWTFFGSPFEQPGNYIYELQVFPSFHPLSLARNHIGKSLVLRRGKLTVLPADQER